jgi:hypothetical protein
MSTQQPATLDEVEIAHEAVIDQRPRLKSWLVDRAALFLREAIPTSEPEPNGWDRGALLALRSRRPLLKRFVRLRQSAGQDADVSESHTVGEPRAWITVEDLGEVEVAHEALIRHWPQLQRLLNEDRDSLQLRESVREAAQEWEAHAHKESYLAHRGRRLEEAAALIHHPRLDLNARELDYLNAAPVLREREAQEREPRRQRELAAERRVVQQMGAATRLRRRLLLAVGLGTQAVLAFIVALVGFQRAAQERNRAAEQATISRIQALAAQAELQHDFGEDDRGALLARQAYLLAFQLVGSGSADQAQVDSALRATLGVKNFSRILNTGGAVNTVAFGAAGELLAAGDRVGRVRLWDANRSGSESRDFIAHEDWVNALAFSPNYTKLDAGGNDGTVWIWNMCHPDDEPLRLSQNSIEHRGNGMMILRRIWDHDAYSNPAKLSANARNAENCPARCTTKLGNTVSMLAAGPRVRHDAGAGGALAR